MKQMKEETITEREDFLVGGRIGNINDNFLKFYRSVVDRHLSKIVNKGEYHMKLEAQQ